MRGCRSCSSATVPATTATQDGPQQARWLQQCQERLHDSVGGGLTPAQFFERIDARSETADEHGEVILAALYVHVEASVSRAP